MWFYLNKQTHKPHTVNSLSLDTSMTQMKPGMSCSSQKLHVVIIRHITKNPLFIIMLLFDVFFELILVISPCVENIFFCIRYFK